MLLIGLSVLSRPQISRNRIGFWLCADFEDEEGKERFARQMMNVWRITSGAFFLALFCLMWALVFMGWGCGFADEAHIPATVGSIGLGVLLLGSFPPPCRA